VNSNKTKDGALPGLGILMEPSCYNDSAPDGTEDEPQPVA